MRYGWLGSVPLLVSSLLIISCGKDSGTVPPKVSTRSVWMADVEVSEELKGVLAASEIKADLHCVQLAHLPQDAEQLVLEISYGQCEPKTTREKPEFRLSVTSRPDSENLGKPITEYVLQHQYLPVGWIKIEDGAVVLRDLCLLDAYYRASCRLDPQEGLIGRLAVSTVASVDRMAREKEAEKRLQDARAESKELKANLAKASELLKTSTGKLEESRATLAGLLTAVEKRAEALSGDLKKKMDGSEQAPGKRTVFTELLKELSVLDARITARRVELEALEAQVKSTQETKDKLEKELKAIRKELSEKREASNQPELSEEQRLALGLETANLQTRLQKTLNDWSASVEALDLALAQLTANTKFEEDANDRKRHAEVKEALGPAELVVRIGTNAGNLLGEINKMTANLKAQLNKGELAQVIIVLPGLSQALGDCEKMVSYVLSVE